MNCPTHHGPLVYSKTRYGGLWKCPEPGCTVLCWSGGTSTPADQETRTARHECHEAFDPLWRDNGGPFSGKSGRQKAYAWLSRIMRVPSADGHIGMFNIRQCQELLCHIDQLLASKSA